MKMIIKLFNNIKWKYKKIKENYRYWKKTKIINFR